MNYNIEHAHKSNIGAMQNPLSTLFFTFLASRGSGYNILVNTCDGLTSLSISQ